MRRLGSVTRSNEHAEDGRPVSTDTRSTVDTFSPRVQRPNRTSVVRHAGEVNLQQASRAAESFRGVLSPVDPWLVPPDTVRRRKRGRDSGRRTEIMAQHLTELVEQFCNFQRKQRGKTAGGVKTYRRMLEQFLVFVRNHQGRLARVSDLNDQILQNWMDDMAGSDLALSAMRSR